MKDTPPSPLGRRAHLAVARPSPGRGALGATARRLLRSSPLADELFARLVHLGAAFRPGSVPIHRREGLRPVFIVGAGRSGNTLLRRILDAGGEIHIPPETYVLGSVISLFRRTRHLGWAQQVNLALAQFQFHPEFDDFGLDLRDLAGELSNISEDRRSLARLIDSFYRFHATKTGRSAARWGDKTPLNVYSLDRIVAVFPDARFVHMLRDGVDVAASYLNAGLMNSITDAASRWRSSLEAVERFQRRHPECCMEIRYEELVVDPISASRRVAEFTGLRFAADMVDELAHVDGLGDVAARRYHAQVRRPVHQESIGAGRRGLSSRELTLLEGLIGPTLARWSYPPVG